MRKSGYLLALLATVLAACGGGSDGTDDAFKPPVTDGNNGGTPPVVVSSITLVTSSPTIPSDGSAPAEITAYVRDAGNKFVENVPVNFTADGGGLQITQGTTDASGIAKATLSALNDPALKTLKVTATAGTIQATVDVRVAGTKLTLQGPASLALQQQGSYTVVLSDASDKGLAGRQVALTSARSNTLSAASVTTDTNGSATFTMTVANGGNDTITASSLGATIALPVTVNSDSFAFISPGSGAEVSLGASQSLTLRWTSSGAPKAGQTVNFSATRGVVTPSSAVTNGNGEVTASISATNAGGSIVTAISGANSAQLPLEFVATTPATIDVQPSIFTLGPGQSSTILAVVRDAQGNLVKNQIVSFSLNDVTGGTLSPGTGTVVTDSQGRAQTIYTASNQTSANEGVIITASVSNGAITDDVKLTVARREVFISLGTGNEVEEPNTAQYRLEYVVQVTDASGNGVKDVPISMRILSTRYHKGARVKATAPATGWDTALSASCSDEDVNRNGTLDAGEDNNGSGRIEAGNIATVTSADKTDADGMVLVYVSYPQEYAYYLDVELSASARVQGSEYVRSLNFRVPGSAPDFASANVSPPGPSSPFGVSATCSDTL